MGEEGGREGGRKGEGGGGGEEERGGWRRERKFFSYTVSHNYSHNTTPSNLSKNHSADIGEEGKNGKMNFHPGHQPGLSGRPLKGF